MNLNNLRKTVAKRRRRLGQGHGSGRMKTSGRGTKGQKARNKVPISFEGGALPLIKRLPFRRGKARNKSFRQKPMPINLANLAIYKKGDIVDLKSLVDKKIISEKSAREKGAKILGSGNISVPLTFKIPVSKSAAGKIEKVGGKIENNTNE